MPKRLSILALEPYYGGSHRAVLDGLVAHIDAEWDTAHAARAQVEVAHAGRGDHHGRTGALSVGSARRFDLVFASTFVNLAEWRGLVGSRLASVPAIVYFHENQLVYPNRHTAEWDFQFPLTNITSALSAERCLFNTRVESGPLPGRDSGLPRPVPRSSTQTGRRDDRREVRGPPPALRSRGLRRRTGDAGAAMPRSCGRTGGSTTRIPRSSSPRLERSLPRVSTSRSPSRARHSRTSRSRSCAPRRSSATGSCISASPRPEPSTRGLLASSDVAVSTAINEFFGIAMIEAAYAGCFPLVPDRLAYPEIYPAQMRYGSSEQLVALLRSLVADRPAAGLARELVEPYTIETLAPRYGQVFERVAASR